MHGVKGDLVLKEIVRARLGRAGSYPGYTPCSITTVRDSNRASTVSCLAGTDSYSINSIMICCINRVVRSLLATKPRTPRSSALGPSLPLRSRRHRTKLLCRSSDCRLSLLCSDAVTI
eukprot:3427564-Rhodomonas_salina.3